MGFYYLKKVLSGYLKEVFIEVADSVIHRNSAYHGRRLCY